MHVDYVMEKEEAESHCTLEELAVVRIIIENPTITQKDLAEKLGKSERTIKTRISSLQERGCIFRVNGKRYGRWEVLVDISDSE